MSARAIVLFVAFVLLLASACVHGFIGIPHLKADLEEIGVRPTLTAAVILGLYVGLIAMFAFAGMVLAAAIAAWRGLPVSAVTLWIICAFYLALGAGGFLFFGGHNIHHLGFALIGCLVGFGAYAPAGGRA
ncbi:MAG TPA: hypothetical protein VLR94_03515 [Acidobacteriota bacterium]|nr:hypothetical protein [Acidobacteriota bacterium]